MASWIGIIASVAVVGVAGTSAWGQAAGKGFDFDQLTRSLNIQGEHEGPIMGLMPSDWGVDRSNLEGFPPLTLSDDGSTAIWRLNMLDVFGAGDADGPPVPMDVVFEQIGDSQYQFRGSSQSPLAAFLAEGDMTVGHEQTFDLTFEGVWHADIQAIGQIAIDMGGFEFAVEDTSFSFGGFDFFAGALADYEGDVQLDLQGLEPSTAQVMIGTMAPIDVVSGSDAESIKFHWEGMQLEAFQAVPTGSEHPVPNVLYGSPEILAASRELSQVLSLIATTGGELTLMTLMVDPVLSLLAEIPVYSEVGAYTGLTTLPMSLVFSEWGETWSLDVENIRISSAKQPGTPADGDFTVDIGPVVFKADEIIVGFDRLLASAAVADFDYVNSIDRISALLRPEGSWGDLSGLILTAFSGLSEEIYVEGLRVSGLETITNGAGLDFGSASNDSADAEMQIDNIWGRIALEDITSPSGAVLTYEYGLDGLTFPWEAITGDTVRSRYLRPGGNGLGDLIPTDAFLQLQVANIPLARWQTQMDMLPRRASILDFDGLLDELNILAAAGFQFLALIAADPLVLTVNAAMGSDLTGIEAEARYLLDFITPETFGSGDGVVTVVQGDLLLQRLMRVNKSMSKELRNPDVQANAADFEFLTSLNTSIRSLSELRALANVTGEGGWHYRVTFDPELGVVVNGLPGADATLLLGN